ncbi:lipopolysaccharide heptosyltransferase II [Thiotrichales bacterium 19S3-7]|nr:lipopolysaccharide heptosyltransferase II [Thiotrichales bacterium 19S3-7]MCF6802290.1 lipopolysaccharide heptosyltransferase II [Thiotrichales bacterium 19S3-11]
MNQKKHYLIVGPSWIGDMIMSQSLYRLLKLHDPDCTIDVLAPKSTIDLVQFMPEVNQAMLAPFKRKKLGLKTRWLLGKSLRKNAYTHAIVLPNSWKSALVVFFTKIKNRIGFKGESRYFLLNELHTLDKEKLPLMIERFCALGINKNQALPSELPWPKLAFDQQAMNQISQKFGFNDSDYQKLIAFCPGAEYGPAKRWPEKYFAKMAVELIKEGYKIVILGGPGDKSISDQITLEFNQLIETKSLSHYLVDFVAKTNITEVVGLLSQVRAVLTNDTGLMHIASAFERPTLVIYGSSSAGFTPPLNKKAESIYLELECRPCFKRTCPLEHMNCLNKLTPEMVLAEFRKIIN